MAIPFVSRIHAYGHLRANWFETRDLLGRQITTARPPVLKYETGTACPMEMSQMRGVVVVSQEWHGDGASSDCSFPCFLHSNSSLMLSIGRND